MSQFQPFSLQLQDYLQRCQQELQQQQPNDFFLFYLQLQKIQQFISDLLHRVSSRANRYGSMIHDTLLCKVFTFLSRDELYRGENICRYWKAALNSTSRRLLFPYSTKPHCKYSYLREAQEGNSWAQAKLAFCYQFGYGTGADGEAAFKWANMSADQGDPEGQAALGKCYLEGFGIEQNLSEAVRLLRTSVSQGNARGQSLLAGCYKKGLGVDCDKKEALRLYLLSAEQGYLPAVVGNGSRYITRVKDLEKGLRFLNLAATQGNPAGQFALGKLYYYGKDVNKDREKAFLWFQSSAYNGHASAQRFLAACYAAGDGVMEDEKQSLRWTTAAAENGDPNSQYYLGMHFKNQGDQEKALQWYQLSADQGHEKARSAIEKLRSTSKI